jgi:hypothetical protein
MTGSGSDGTRDDRIPFLITIDAELDDGWSAPASPTTNNAVYLPRFQELCERYGLKPTYLTNYEMAVDPRYVEFGRDVLARDVGEIGMHLHAWNSPPTDHQLTPRDHAYVPYLMEYPTPVMRDKVAFLTDLLAETFGSQPRSHRAGRWAMDVRYFKLLAEFGYRTDCSVTPFQTWASYSGTPSGPRGTDYRLFPSVPYRLDPEQPSLPNPDGPLLEVPMTVLAPLRTVTRRLPAASFRSAFFSRAYGKVLPSRWLRPNGDNLQSMLSIVESVHGQAGSHLEFMIHSSELMPGGSPRFRTPESVERLYEDLEMLFEAVARRGVGMTLAEFADSFDQKAVFS